MSHEIKPDLGREIRKYSQTAEFKLRSSGKYGRLSFILSFVEQGQGCEFEIENEAVAICGEDIRQQVYDAVVEGMNRYWIRDEGHLRPLKTAANSATDTAPGLTALEHGFGIIRAAQNLKLAFNEAGQDGRVSFAKACIWSGLTQPDEIVAEACAIAGDRVESAFESLLMEGENIHWLKCVSGSLELMTDA
ncbi:hypothetical protein A9995_09030 [Erythrobacter sp. QSSC1-22B]|uniref:hypothetical protein n=1 Tax=Erythrobacter sp. QSSC1-22B TaxID=1860125 RepID=UPI00080481FC|nr:hypothetical protein [Erythrobacter sp. QSSC1-22B]OBX19250.1 hypothetical protein A9995_09030 [Erythrobacter sp. QSSC1-22B]